MSSAAYGRLTRIFKEFGDDERGIQTTVNRNRVSEIEQEAIRVSGLPAVPYASEIIELDRKIRIAREYFLILPDTEVQSSLQASLEGVVAFLVGSIGQRIPFELSDHLVFQKQQIESLGSAMEPDGYLEFFREMVRVKGLAVVVFLPEGEEEVLKDSWQAVFSILEETKALIT